MVISELGVFVIDKKGDAPMRLVALAPGVTEEGVRAKTEADYTVAMPA
jgi:3-oxoacid CoA-transferase subunit B